MENEVSTELKKTTLIWWRYGKEHERADPNPPQIRNNGPEMAAASLDARLAHTRSDDEHDWRIWQLAPNLIIERVEQPMPSWARSDTMFHYLLDDGIAVMENFYSRRYGRLSYIHICEYSYDDLRQTWIMKDLFTDLLVSNDGRLVTVLDLDDLADAHEAGLLTSEQSNKILRHTQHIIRRIMEGGFPFPEMRQAHLAARLLGWETESGQPVTR